MNKKKNETYKERGIGSGEVYIAVSPIENKINRLLRGQTNMWVSFSEDVIVLITNDFRFRFKRNLKVGDKIVDSVEIRDWP